MRLPAWTYWPALAGLTGFATFNLAGSGIAILPALIIPLVWAVAKPLGDRWATATGGLVGLTGAALQWSGTMAARHCPGQCPPDATVPILVPRGLLLLFGGACIIVLLSLFVRGPAGLATRFVGPAIGLAVLLHPETPGGAMQFLFGGTALMMLGAIFGIVNRRRQSRAVPPPLPVVQDG